MSTPLTGTRIQDTYLTVLICNGGVTGTLHNIADAAGHDSALSVSTGAAKVTGTLEVTGATTLDAALNLTSHLINNVTDPSAAQDAATKNYVDLAVAALAAKNDVSSATVAALAAATYNNGSSGVGATLTLTVAAVLVVDGYTPVLNDRILIKNQASAVHNGLYYLSTVGVVLGAQAVLTRTLDFDQSGDGINGALVYVLNGTTNGNTLWSCTTAATITFGTTNINWSKFLGSTYTADGTTLTLTGTTFSLTLTNSNTFTAQQNFGPAAALTDGSSIAWNLATAQVAKVTLGGNRTLANPTNMVDGGTYILRVTQDGTGSRTLAYGNAYKWPGGTAPTLTTTASAVDIISFVSNGTSMFGSILQAFA